MTALLSIQLHARHDKLESWQPARLWRERTSQAIRPLVEALRLDLAEIGIGVDKCSENYCLRSSPSS
jgi:hypothetical protein